MELHDIHGTKVTFHGGAEHGLFFLRDEMHIDGVKGYFKLAKDKGIVHFTDKNGINYNLQHNKADDSFAVSRNYSSLYKS